MNYCNTITELIISFLCLYDNYQIKDLEGTLRVHTDLDLELQCTRLPRFKS